MQDIINRNFTNLFLFQHELTSWCRENNIAYGPGRGADAGSLVVYLLEITDINPLEYGLLYERFVNPERITYPDFDIDYDTEKIDDIVNHLKERYGKDHVARIASYHKLNAKTAICNKSFHSSGYIVTKEPVCNYAPVLIDKSGVLYCEYSLDETELCGLYKTDILGLDKLTKFEKITALIRKSNPDFDYKTIPLDDEKTLAAFIQAQTDEVFQFDSEEMKDILKKIKPEKFTDLVLLNAMYRPGLIDYLPSVIESKNNSETIQYDDPCLEDILKETYGVMVYQEQVMQVAQRIAGYSLGGGDVLRRAIGKKKIEVVKQKEKEFINAAVNNGFTEQKAKSIFEKIIQMGGYCFNKSHAVAYTKMAFWDMYLKVHYVDEYYNG